MSDEIHIGFLGGSSLQWSVIFPEGILPTVSPQLRIAKCPYSFHSHYCRPSFCILHLSSPGVFPEFIDVTAATSRLMLVGLPSLPGLGIDLLKQVLLL